ncbi:MAG: amidohydrolase family protein [Actinomycetota bacterium]|nr:amidohydrolase family protein [Actinomycetota bacterium]
MATISGSRRRKGSAAQVWFVELTLAAVVFTIAATIVEPDVFDFSTPLDARAIEEQVEAIPQEPPRLESAATTAPPPADDHVYDVAITGGRVMDPDSGYDEMANVGIDDGTVTEITDAAIQGKKEVDASGLVVAPGFIDLESYDPNPYGIWYKIADGVTTNLGMHGTNGFADEWYQQWTAVGSPAHFGGAFDDNWYRQRPDGMELGVSDEATPAQIDELVEAAKQGLEDGFIGIEFAPEYAPGISYEEIVAVSQVAADYNVPVFFHGRYSDPDPPGTNQETMEEVIQTGRDTGAKVHVLHINSTGGTYTMEDSLAQLEAARAEGVEITADEYPYNFWATTLASERFAPGWQERFRIDYEDLVIPGTGERLTEETFEIHQANNDLAAAYAIPEKDVRTALQSDHVMIGSDAILEPGDNNHPRAAGTFSRVLGKYVREEKVISLMEGLSKMTIQPARLLEEQAPALQLKGRLQIGAHADITIFDPETISDRATVTDPSQYSKGVEWVFVMGKAVKDPDGFNKKRLPGEPIMSDFSNLDIPEDAAAETP